MPVCTLVRLRKHLCIVEFDRAAWGKSEVEKEILRWVVEKSWKLYKMKSTLQWTFKFVFLCPDEITERDEMNAMDQILLVNSSK